MLKMVVNKNLKMLDFLFINFSMVKYFFNLFLDYWFKRDFFYERYLNVNNIWIVINFINHKYVNWKSKYSVSDLVKFSNLFENLINKVFEWYEAGIIVVSNFDNLTEAIKQKYFLKIFLRTVISNLKKNDKILEKFKFYFAAFFKILKDIFTEDPTLLTVFKTNFIDHLLLDYQHLKKFENVKFNFFRSEKDIIEEELNQKSDKKQIMQSHYEGIFSSLFEILKENDNEKLFYDTRLYIRNFFYDKYRVHVDKDEKEQIIALLNKSKSDLDNNDKNAESDENDVVKPNKSKKKNKESDRTEMEENEKPKKTRTRGSKEKVKQDEELNEAEDDETKKKEKQEFLKRKRNNKKSLKRIEEEEEAFGEEEKEVDVEDENLIKETVKIKNKKIDNKKSKDMNVRGRKRRSQEKVEINVPEVEKDEVIPKNKKNLSKEKSNIKKEIKESVSEELIVDTVETNKTRKSLKNKKNLSKEKSNIKKEIKESVSKELIVDSVETNKTRKSSKCKSPAKEEINQPKIENEEKEQGKTKSRKNSESSNSQVKKEVSLPSIEKKSKARIKIISNKQKVSETNNTVKKTRAKLSLKVNNVNLSKNNKTIEDKSKSNRRNRKTVLSETLPKEEEKDVENSGHANPRRNKPQIVRKLKKLSANNKNLLDIIAGIEKLGKSANSKIINKLSPSPSVEKKSKQSTPEKKSSLTSPSPKKQTSSGKSTPKFTEKDVKMEEINIKSITKSNKSKSPTKDESPFKKNLTSRKKTKRGLIETPQEASPRMLTRKSDKSIEHSFGDESKLLSRGSSRKSSVSSRTSLQNKILDRIPQDDFRSASKFNLTPIKPKSKSPARKEENESNSMSPAREINKKEKDNTKISSNKKEKLNISNSAGTSKIASDKGKLLGKKRHIGFKSDLITEFDPNTPVKTLQSRSPDRLNSESQKKGILQRKNRIVSPVKFSFSKNNQSPKNEKLNKAKITIHKKVEVVPISSKIKNNVITPRKSFRKK